MNEYLNFPGKELNVPIIQSNKFFKKNNETGHIGLLIYFHPVTHFWNFQKHEKN